MSTARQQFGKHVPAELTRTQQYKEVTQPVSK
jgi:hypothetical protein